MKKVKIIVAAIALLSVTSLSFGQGSLGKGRSQLNAGLGLHGYGVPVYIGFDYGVHPDITIGGDFSFSNYNDNGYYRDHHDSYYCFALNGNYHFNRILEIPSEFDFYAGLSLGFYAWTYDHRDDRYHDRVYRGIQVGGRYFFSNNFGVNLEFGGSNNSGGKIGITYKF